MPQTLAAIHERLRQCRRCPNVCGRAVHGPALDTRVMLVGQAPGVHEGRLGKPFAFTAGKTLFKWLYEATGAEEEDLRELIYFSAVARCFPGKHSTGKGDRPPSKQEMENCREHLRDEVRELKPQLILAVGKLAISEVLGQDGPLEKFVGRKFSVEFHGQKTIVIPLPHPSGVSRWPHTEPGKSKLKSAIKLIGRELRKVL
jgi:uracil-DNA glycosylase